MKGQCRGVGEFDMELELIEINVDTFFGFFSHCRIPGDLVEEFCDCVDMEEIEIVVWFEPLTDCELF